MKIVIGVVEENETFSGVCSCQFITRFWPTDEIAADRIRQHKAEHETGKLMELLSEFRESHGLVAIGNKAVLPDDVVVLDEEEEEGGD